jgi:hypothetical protein
MFRVWILNFAAGVVVGLSPAPGWAMNGSCASALTAERLRISRANPNVLHPGNPVPFVYLTGSVGSLNDAKIPWSDFPMRSIEIFYDPAGVSEVALGLSGPSVLNHILNFPLMSRRLGIPEAAAALVQATAAKELQPPYSEFQERALFVGTRRNRFFLGNLFSSRERIQIDEKSVVSEYNAFMEQMVSQSDGLDSVSYVHTHPGTATPLSLTDKAIMVSLRLQSARQSFPIESFHIYAVLPANRNLVFHYRVTTPDLESVILPPEHRHLLPDPAALSRP